MKKVKDGFDRTLERIFKEDPSFKQEMRYGLDAWDVAFQIYDLRKKMGLTQTELAKLVHTSQANISRIEAADYPGYTMKTLEKVAKALKAKLQVKIIPEDQTVVTHLHKIK